MKDNIISIRKKDIKGAKKAFEELMSRTESKMNDESILNPHLFKGISAFQLEKQSERYIKSVCSGTPFSEDDIRLVSGHSFPDIIAGKFYGVEVKSTEKDHWTSTGSSIVESTRDENVSDIYMLFGNLGGQPPLFKCKPYQSVLKEISVTHSPRYLIDMNLEKSETIFNKLGMSYDEFRINQNKIDIVRQYYKKKAKQENKSEVPWWLGETTPITMDVIRKGFPTEKKSRLISELLILFDSIIQNDYDEAAVWLCTRRNTINPSFRDMFTAGGRCTEINGVHLPTLYPHIVATILSHRKEIENILSDPVGLILDLNQCWIPGKQISNYYEEWIIRTVNAFKLNNNLKHIPIEKYIREEQVVTALTHN